MITIRHSDLDNCLRDPSLWVAQLLNQNQQFRRAGYNEILLNGIFQFHKKQDYEVAREYIDMRLERNRLQNKGRIEDLLQSFDEYVLWFNKEQPTVADVRYRLSYELGYGIALGGTVSRIDLTSTGYRAVLLGHIPRDWQGELRMPMLQRALAQAFGRRERQFAIGWQELNGTNLQATIYDSSAIDDAENRIRVLALGVAEEYDRQKV